MRTDTKSVTVDARPEDVLAFVADGQNLPRWAIGFAKTVRPSGDGWVVTTGSGDISTRIESDPTTGTVDFHMAAPDGTHSTAFGRVLPNAAGSEFLFTQMQQPGMSDEIFEQLVTALEHELVTLKALMEVECRL